MTESAIARLLIVDDEAALMTALCNTLEVEGYATTGFTSARAALAELAERQFDILLTDLMMPEMDGIDLLRAAQETDRDLAGIVMTGHGTIDTAVKALQSGALDYVLKPFRLDNLLPVLTRALATRRLHAENIQLREAVSIYELARAITTGLEYEEIVERTLSAAMRQNDAGTGCLLVPTEDGRELRIAGVRGLDANWAPDRRFPLDTPLVQWISTAREQLSSWDGSGPLQAVFEQPFKDHQHGAALPVVAGGNFYGILVYSSHPPQRRLNAGQIKALDILASTAASAFEAASLLAQLRGMNQELEQRIQDRTRDLEASNAELEAFSYSVSHDLRAPLRAIDGFTAIFLADHGTGVPPEGRALLEKVCAGVAGMHRLIDDLLHLSHFSRQPLEVQRVPMMDLARSVATNLEQQSRGRDVHLHVADLPDCQGDGSLLEHVFTNLLSNALKFTAGREQARIEVGAFRQDTEQVYFVRDNGVGFDMKYAHKLFGAFQRLHSQTEFAGSGIGLSIVHRIIRRHGGRTWAESQPQHGATIYFTLPDRDPVA
jgi:signal transduction histidine kinase/FixJ family two-component response regulator